MVMQVYNLSECSDYYSKTSEILWHYSRDEPFFDANDAITDFPAANNNIATFIFEDNIIGKTISDGTKDVKIMVPLK